LAGWSSCCAFQSPHGDFGFLKRVLQQEQRSPPQPHVSIPSRGFWFFEGASCIAFSSQHLLYVSIPSRGFWFFEAVRRRHLSGVVQLFQSPHGDFGFLKRVRLTAVQLTVRFNPLTGILVF